VSSLPLYLILPLVDLSSCKITLPNVDFPHPDSPTNPKVSPSKTLKLISSTALTIFFLFKNPTSE